MVEITAAMVKELRERTDSGMMECKKALVQAEGDMQAAIDILALSGQRKAINKASRVAAQGRISIISNERSAAMTEINCETDFVARDESFMAFCQKTTEIALKEASFDNEKLLNASFDGSITVEDARKNLVGRIGENVQLRRAYYHVAEGNQRIGAYSHHGRIGVIVVIEGGSDALAKDLAMHTAAMRPQYLTMTSVPDAVVQREKAILIERAKESGKPDNMLEKITAGQLQKYLGEISLEGQPFFKDQDQTVGAIVKAANATLVHMVRFEVGEGIEVVKTNFEDEVKAAAGSIKS